MSKLFLTGTAVIFLSLIMPMATWADDIKETVTITAQDEIFKNDSFTLHEPMTMYSNGNNVNIRREPNVDSEILGQAIPNTSFEVIGIYNNWYMITTEDGYAYIKSEYLSSDEIQDYSDEELFIMAHLICGEAQYCPDEEQRYVGSVVLNRVKHPEFPNSIKDVVFDPGQYACVKDGNYYREPTESNWNNARWILENGSVLPDNVIWQSGGKQGKGEYIRTKWHSYCY